jgi:hypothetical protein
MRLYDAAALNRNERLRISLYKNFLYVIVDDAARYIRPGGFLWLNL